MAAALLALAALAALRAAAAAPCDVYAAADAAPSSSCGGPALPCPSIQEALLSRPADCGDATVWLSAGLFAGANNTGLSLAPGDALNVTLAGAGAGRTRIDAAASARHFAVTGPGVRLRVENATLAAGRDMEGAGGGCVFAEARAAVELASASVEGCLSPSGGAVFLASNATLAVAGSTFANNSAGAEMSGRVYEGGAVTAVGGAAVDVADSLFEFNSAAGGVGGAVSLLGGASLRARNSTFWYNSAAVGGAVAESGSQITADDVWFEGNSAQPGTTHNGAAETDDDGASTVGGALFLSSSSSSAQSVFTRCNFVLNECDADSVVGGQGGAAFLSDASPRFDRCLFARNVARGTDAGEGGFGGALYLYGEACRPELTDCEFASNEAESGGLPSSAGGGGAVALRDASPRFTRAVFQDNAAGPSRVTEQGGFGGAVLASSVGALADVACDACTFTDNVALAAEQQTTAQNGQGGAVYSDGARWALTDSTFERNAALGATYGDGDVGGFGGAVFAIGPADGIAGARFDCDGCAFLSNQAGVGYATGGQGGAVYAQVPVRLSGGTVADNTAARGHATGGYGGALFVEDSTLELANLTIANNVAEGASAAAPGFGGAIVLVVAHAPTAKASVVGCVLEENYVTGSLSVGAPLAAEGAAFAGGGGAVFIDGGQLTVLDSVFALNHAPADVPGGAILIDGAGNATVAGSPCLFTNNHAETGAAACAAGTQGQLCAADVESLNVSAACAFELDCSFVDSCQQCTANASCSWAADDAGSGCDVASADAPNDPTQCCPSGCSGHGDCRGDVCDCDWFYQDTDCGEFSAVAIAVVSCSGVVALFSLGCLLCRCRYKRRERALRGELLRKDQSVPSAAIVRPSEITLSRVIGQGVSGVVYLGEFRGGKVAVKKMQAPVERLLAAADSDDARDALLLSRDSGGGLDTEAYLMSTLRHPNIVLFMAACLDNGELFIVTEFCEHGSLYDVLHDDGVELSLTLRRQLAADMARGLVYLHASEPPIVHQDLKSLNVLISGDWRAKLADFGLSRSMAVGHRADEPGQTSAYGTTRWNAPELVRAAATAEKPAAAPAADVYSLGIVLWELIARQVPYDHLRFPHMVDAAVLRGERPAIPPGVSLNWQSLMLQCWSDDPDARPSAAEVLRRLSSSSGGGGGGAVLAEVAVAAGSSSGEEEGGEGGGGRGGWGTA